MARSLGRQITRARQQSRSPSNIKKSCNNVQIDEYNISNTEYSSDDEIESVPKFLYMHVKISNLEISALIDTGSSINVMSQQCYNSIPDPHTSNFKSASETITLANNQCVNIFGTSDIKITVSQGKHWIPVYIMSQTSHPLILGTNYLCSKNIVLDFSNHTSAVKFMNVHTQKPISIPPNTETMIWGKLKGNVRYGTQGICRSKIKALKTLV